MGEQLAVVRLMDKSKSYIDLGLRRLELAANRSAVYFHLVLSAVRQRHFQMEARSDRSHAGAVQQNVAAVLGQMGGNQPERNLQISARMRADGRGVDVALDFKIV